MRFFFCMNGENPATKRHTTHTHRHTPLWEDYCQMKIEKLSHPADVLRLGCPGIFAVDERNHWRLKIWLKLQPTSGLCKTSILSFGSWRKDVLIRQNVGLLTTWALSQKSLFHSNFWGGCFGLSSDASLGTPMGKRNIQNDLFSGFSWWGRGKNLDDTGFAWSLLICYCSPELYFVYVQMFFCSKKPKELHQVHKDGGFQAEWTTGI